MSGVTFYGLNEFPKEPLRTKVLGVVASRSGCNWHPTLCETRLQLPLDKSPGGFDRPDAVGAGPGAAPMD